MDYPRLSVSELSAAFAAVADEAPGYLVRSPRGHSTGNPRRTDWSVAQCFEHLLKANAQMFEAADQAVDGAGGRSLWQRLPGWPRLCGRLLITSQAPTGARKFTAPSKAQPTASTVDADVVPRFVAQQRDAMTSSLRWPTGRPVR